MGDITPAAVEASLAAALPGALTTVVDTSGGCGAAFEVSLVWQGFAGKPRLARHRAVTGALASLMPSIHALSIKKAATPEEEEEKAAAAAAPAPAAT